MTVHRAPALPALILAAALAAALAGCGRSASAPPPPPAARLVAERGAPHGVIVLTPLGAERIGLVSAPVRAARAGVLVPASAIVYDPSGRPLAFVRHPGLRFTEEPVRIARFLGPEVLLAGGPPPGVQVVSVGAEELFGVQSGVLAQT